MRWLGVGLAAVLAVVTLGLAVTGRLGLYINPESSWFAVSMAVLLLVGAAVSFVLPLGAEADHGHDHGDEPRTVERATEDAGVVRSATKRADATHDPATRDADVAHVPATEGADVAHVPATARSVASLTGGVVASGVVLSILLLPPASLSAELAMSRDVGTAPLFAGADTVALATTGDTASFGVGDWASVFASATDPGAFEGATVSLTGFVTPADAGGFDLTRLVITHCVIDAQSASVPVAPGDAAALDTGQWVTVTGTVRSNSDGALEIAATDVERIDEPRDPYDY